MPSVSAITKCCFVAFLIGFIIEDSAVFAANQMQCSTDKECTDNQVCRIYIGICLSCKELCDTSFKYYSSSFCSDLCPGFVSVKTSKTPIVLIKDIKNENKVPEGTRVVATMLHEKDNSSLQFDVQENGESIGTVLSLGDMAAICGVIAFIIFCIGLRILTKEYPCPWFATPMNTKPTKLDENTDEMAELNV